jgi:hypothetical protein
MMFNLFNKRHKRFDLDQEIKAIGEGFIGVVRRRYGYDLSNRHAQCAIMAAIAVAIATTKGTNADPGAVAAHFFETMSHAFPNDIKGSVCSKSDVLDMLKDEQGSFGFCPPNVTKH